MSMYYLKRWIIRKIYKYIFRLTPGKMEMVRYWRTSEALPAAVTTDENGATIMKMGDGDRKEKYPFPGFPRSHILFGTFRGRPYGPLSVLKHEVKQIFNYAHYALEEGKSKEEIIREIKCTKLPAIYEMVDECRYIMLPPEKMFKGVKEVWRAMSVIEERHPESRIRPFKELLTFLMSDDDAYRMRIQFLVQVFGWGNPVKNLEIALKELENAEVLRDMKDKVSLLRSGLLLILEDPKFKQLFLEFYKEVDWKKLRLSKGDLFHLRAKYFKADWHILDY